MLLTFRFPFFSILLLAGLPACHERKPARIGGIEVPVHLLDAARETSFDYTGNLYRALEGDTIGLRQLFFFCEKTDEAQALAHGKVLQGILQKLGDGQFAQQLANCPGPERLAVWEALEPSAKQPLRETAPQTWAAILPAATVQKYRGLYVFDRKMDTFRDCAAPGRRYIAIDETGQIERNYLRLLRKPYPGEAMFAELKGLTTDRYGSRQLPADFAGFLIVTEILELEAKNYRNTCIPYEVWAIGTEPFWQAQVSAAEGLMEFRTADSESTKYFPYLPPTVQDTATVYASVDESTGDNIRVVVKEAPCSDGMSDIRYELQVAVTVNGQDYTGCGIPFGG